MGVDMWYTRGYVEGVHDLQTTYATTPDVQKYTFIMSLETSQSLLSFCATRICVSGLVCHLWTFCFFLFLSPLPRKLQLDPLGCWYFNFSPYSFNFSFLFLVLSYKFYYFSISSLNPNLTNIIFFNLVLILWISNFLPWYICKSFIGFQFHPSIQIDGFMFFNLVLIVLIFFP